MQDERSTIDSEFYRFGVRLAANKLACEYLASQTFGAVEPEGFADLWVDSNVAGSTTFRNDIVADFLQMLYEGRKKR
jgi:hypothetical protein